VQHWFFHECSFGFCRGWGLSSYQLNEDPRQLKLRESLLGVTAENRASFSPPELSDIRLNPPRFELPPDIDKLCSSDTFERVRHTYGMSFRDLLRVFDNKFDLAPDYVAFPETENDISRIMRYCGRNSIALIPVGGGSSVVGGIEPRATIGAGSGNSEPGHYRFVFVLFNQLKRRTNLPMMFFMFSTFLIFLMFVMFLMLLIFFRFLIFLMFF